MRPAFICMYVCVSVCGPHKVPVNKQQLSLCCDIQQEPSGLSTCESIIASWVL